MRTPRLIPFVLALLVTGAVFAGAQSAEQAPAAVGEGPTLELDASRVILPCIPVAAYWTGPPPSAGMPPGPDLAVVAIDVRPKDAQVHLDGRFVGRARYLDGKPGYLYLEPGSYELELRLEGYRTVLVELDARASCRYDLRHRLESAKGSSTGMAKDVYGKGKPFNRVYGPLAKDEPAAASSRPAGPDPSLRKDLDRKSGQAADEATQPGASLRLRVTPESASVSIDGVFVATARELGLMERPLATTAGKHHLDVRAPGFVEASRDVELIEGEVLELEFTLSENQTK
jgi:hypothetical protein